MRCSHVSGLSGTYTSLEIDTAYTSSEEALCYLDYTLVVTSPDNTWNGVAPQPTACDELPATDTWISILGLGDAAPKLSISLLTSVSSGGPYDEEIGRLETLIVSLRRRYVKVKFTIEDPNLSTNVEIYPSTLKTFQIT